MNTYEYKALLRVNITNETIYLDISNIFDNSLSLYYQQKCSSTNTATVN